MLFKRFCPDERIIVIFIIDFLSTRDNISGGTERQLIEIINHLDKSKFRPILFCLQELSKSDLWENANCEKTILDIYSILSYDSLLTILRLAKFISRNRINIVNLIFYDSILVGTLCAIIGRAENIVSWRRDLGFWYTGIRLKFLKIMNIFADKILTNSQSVKIYIQRVEGVKNQKICVLNNGVNNLLMQDIPPVSLKQLSPNIRPGTKIVGLVANFNRQVKRVDLFLEASAIVSKYFPNCAFVIVGGGKLKNRLIEQASELCISDKVFFVGHQKNAISYIKKFDIGVLSSDSEGFPNVLIEYMACGIPIVSTATESGIELFSGIDVGILTPVGDKFALAEAICCLLKDPERCRRLGTNAKSHIEKSFAWNNRIKEYETFFSSLAR